MSTRRNVCLMFLCVLVFAATTWTPALSDYRDALTGLPVDPIGYWQFTHLTSGPGGAIHRIALGRLRTIDDLAASLRYSRFWILNDFDGEFEVLFPTGHSERVYLLIEDDAGIAAAGSQFELRCYQYRHGQLQVVYKVSLTNRKLPATTHKLRNLMDFLSSLPYTSTTLSNGVHVSDSLTVRGNFSRYAEGDLLATRDYAEYGYNPMNDVLSTALISNHTAGESRMQAEASYYATDEDPSTSSEIAQEEFYKRYGLPLSSGEIRSLVGGVK